MNDPPVSAPDSPTPQPVAVHQQTVITTANPTKSVGGAVALTFFFGPLGMLYSTVPGAIVMFFVNIIVAVFTLGLGLLLTWPICMVWAGVEASNHNNRVARSSEQVFQTPVPPQPVPSTVTAPAVQAPSAPATPKGWHDDPDDSGRLRYWDGTRWTAQYRDREPQLARETEASSAGSSDEASCAQCGSTISSDHTFCRRCGARQ